MEKSPRKPAGKTAFIVATSWLHEETAYAGKLLLLQSWEDVKMIITKFPAPDNFGALVYGVDVCSADAAFNLANEKGWGEKLIGRAYHIRGPAVPTVHRSLGHSPPTPPWPAASHTGALARRDPRPPPRAVTSSRSAAWTYTRCLGQA